MKNEKLKLILNEIKKILLTIIICFTMVSSLLSAYILGYTTKSNDILDKVIDDVLVEENVDHKESIRKRAWQGTAVPNSGVVEKIYFNTSKTMEEVVSILEQLTYTQTNLMVNPLCPVLFASDGNPVVFIGQLTMDNGTLTGGYCISIVTDMANSVYINAFNYDNGNAQDGWLLDNYDVNKEVISNYNGLPIGNQNELIKDIISITPFTQSGDSTRLPVPNQGYVENVYLNINLSFEEVVSILSNLDYGDIGVYYPLGSPSSQIGLMIVYIDGVYGIANEYTNFIYFIGFDSGLGYVGWNPNFNGIIEVNNEVVNELNGISIGLQNDKLTSLFSITPFTGSEEDNRVLGTLFDAIGQGLFGMINPILSAIKVGFQSFIYDVEGGVVVPSSGLVNRVYINKSLSTDAVNSIIDEALKDVDWVTDSNTTSYKTYNVLLNDLDGSLSNMTFLQLQIIRNNSGGTYTYNYSIFKFENEITITIYNDGWYLSYTSDYVDFNKDTNIELDLNEELIELFSMNQVFVKPYLDFSYLAYFLFSMFGISVGIGLIWLVLSLFKNRG